MKLIIKVNPHFLFFIVILLLINSRTFAQDKRPNIIFLLTDDQRALSLGGTGHPWVKTPNIDYLIESGINFKNAYIAEPTCAPSRTAIFTGMHERINGVGFSSSYNLTEAQWEESYPALIKKSGYYTGFIGKFGVEFYTFKGKANEKFDYWWGHDGWTKFFPKDFETHNTKPYHKAEKEIITPIMGEAIEDFLEKAPKEKPFCLSVSFNIPHGSQTTSMFTENEKAVAMMLPANENPKLFGHPIYDSLYRNIEIKIPNETGANPYQYIPLEILDQMKGRANRTYPYAYNPISVGEWHVRYYQQITGLDKVIGDLIQNLKHKGLFDNTVIIFASDHGLLMGEYGMGGKALLYDLVTKIPCFVYDPFLQKSQRGKTIEELVSSLDITTTILDYAGIEPAVNMEGKSLKPLIYRADGENVNWRQEIFLENLFTMRDNPFCEGIRRGKWKYIRMFKGVDNYREKDIDFSARAPDFEQLFDLKEDPSERNNLLHKYEGRELLDDLRHKCQEYSQTLNKKRKRYLKSKEYINERN